MSDFKLILTGDLDKIEETIFSCYFLQMFGKESDFSAVMKGSLG